MVAPCSCAGEALARRLDPDQRDVVVEEVGEDADRVRPAADAGDHRVGQASLDLEDLRARFLADDALKFAHHQREGMRAGDGAEQVMRVGEARGPVAQRLVDRILERPRAGGDGDDFGAHQLHPEDVERLPLDIVGAHVDPGLQARTARRRARSRRRAGRRRSRRSAGSCPCAWRAAPGPAPGWSCARRRGADPRA